jgi:hypothetical protein
MLRYRCYLIGEKNRVLGMQEFRAQSGDEAIGIARKFTLEQRARSYELWERTRYFHGEKHEAGAAV